MFYILWCTQFYQHLQGYSCPCLEPLSPFHCEQFDLVELEIVLLQRIEQILAWSNQGKMALHFELDCNEVCKRLCVYDQQKQGQKLREYPCHNEL